MQPYLVNVAGRICVDNLSFSTQYGGGVSVSKIFDGWLGRKVNNYYCDNNMEASQTIATLFNGFSCEQIYFLNGSAFEYDYSKVQRKNTFYSVVDKKMGMELIDSFSMLEEDWDSEGARKINEIVISNALKIWSLIAKYGCLPEISPMPNGVISFDWDTSLGSATIEVGKTKFVFYAYNSRETIYTDKGGVQDLLERADAFIKIIKTNLYPYSFFDKYDAANDVSYLGEFSLMM